ncbi:hypothetical protein [Dinghuibacter silviterrae]|uniref:ABC-2 type transport system permease protein n=1 Tax=Dinghuibacter silviterrae TaxID=1539049 RepID=A0A4R8DND3_9BACT|nr:hypothetical protein [Dinghuibacter silviterrae]TDW99207.1 hypothetical protein EDB95_0216 [Dinghuibacter silviterrae]
MKNFILRLVMLFSPFWRKLGADTNQLEAILWVKLTMDDRRPRAVFARHQKRKKAVNNATVATVLTSLVMGCFYLFTFWVGKDNFTALTLYFLMFMVMLSVTLISDFTDVLIDVKDNYIILPKPVGARTILLARLLHILIHLSKIVVPMMLPGLVYCFVRIGIGGGLLFGLDVAFATLLCICVINAVYLVILRITTVERFKDVIGTIQVAFSILIFATYYMGPRLAANLHLDQTAILGHAYFYPAPPLWLAALWEVLQHPAGQTGLLYGLAALGLLIPPLSIWAVVRFLGPSFDRKLSGLGAGTPAVVTKKRRGRGTFYRSISAWVTKGNAESTGFEISWLLTGRSRDFKLKVYPSFAYVLVYFFYYGLQGRGQSSLGETWRHLPETKTYILLIYMSSLAMITAITNLVYSDKYKASWVYYVSPLRVPGEVLVGSVKAMLVKYFIPFYLAVAVFALYIWGIRILPDLALGLANVIWFGLLMGYVRLKKLPFSASMSIQAGTGRFMKGLMIVLIPTAVGFGHYFIRLFLPALSWVIWLIFVLAAILVWLLYSRYREVSWAELEKASGDF